MSSNRCPNHAERPNKRTTLPRCRNDVGTCKRRRRGVGEVSEQNSVGPTRLRHGIGVGEVLRYCSDTVSESERCSDTIPTRCRSSIGVGEVLRYGVGAGSEQNINKFTFYSAFHSAYIQLLIKGIHHTGSTHSSATSP